MRSYCKLILSYFLNIKLTDLKKELVTLTWDNSKCSTVEVSGLDIGWGQVIVFY